MTTIDRDAVLGIIEPRIKTLEAAEHGARHPDTISEVRRILSELRLARDAVRALPTNDEVAGLQSVIEDIGDLASCWKDTKAEDHASMLRQIAFDARAALHKDQDK